MLGKDGTKVLYTRNWWELIGNELKIIKSFRVWTCFQLTCSNQFLHLASVSPSEMPMSLAVPHTIAIQQTLPGIKSKCSTSQKNETDSQAIFGHLSHKMGNIWNTNHPIQGTYSELATVPDTFHNFLNLHNGPRGKKWLHMAEEDTEAQPGKWMPRVPLDKCLDTARIHLSLAPRPCWATLIDFALTVNHGDTGRPFLCRI